MGTAQTKFIVYKKEAKVSTYTLKLINQKDVHLRIHMLILENQWKENKMSFLCPLIVEWKP